MIVPKLVDPFDVNSGGFEDILTKRKAGAIDEFLIFRSIALYCVTAPSWRELQLIN